MERIEIQRMYRDDCTLGVLSYHSSNGDAHFRCFTLELPDENNQPNISCIPEGNYLANVRCSLKNGMVLALMAVPGRTHIQVHAGNFTHQIEGCILVGDAIKFLDNDGIPDITNSNRTLRSLLQIVPQEVEIAIYG